MPLTFRARHAVRATLLACVLAVAAAAQTAASNGRGFIWKAERDGQAGWVVGSIHVLTPDYYPLPEPMQKAFGRATTLVEEMDLKEMMGPDALQALASKAFYTGGQTLETELSAETYALIAKRIDAAGLPLEAFHRMKPWMIALTLMAVELKRGGFDPALGLDRHFYERAAEAGKKFLALESAVDQIEHLASIAPELQEEMLRQQVETTQSQVAQVRSIADAWKNGDAALLERVTLTPLRGWPRAYDLLIVQRNRAWLPRIESCLAASGCFVVVGAGHVVGPDGLLEMLKKNGYTIEQQ